MIEGGEPSATWNDRRHTSQPHACFPFWICEVIIDSTQTPSNYARLGTATNVTNWSSLMAIPLGVRQHTLAWGCPTPVSIVSMWRGGAVCRLCWHFIDVAPRGPCHPAFVSSLKGSWITSALFSADTALPITPPKSGGATFSQIVCTALVTLQGWSPSWSRLTSRSLIFSALPPLWDE